MKKKVLSVMAVAAVALVAGYNVYTAQKSKVDMSDLALANVEALAEGENPMCPNGCSGPGNGCYCNGWYPYLAEA